MDVHTVFAVVQLSVRAETEDDAVASVRKHNALYYDEMPELESAKAVLVKGVGVSNGSSGIANMLAIAGAGLEILERRKK